MSENDQSNSNTANLTLIPVNIITKLPQKPSNIKCYLRPL